MSRIGKQVVQVPTGVEARIKGREVTIKGPKGEISMTHSPAVRVEQGDGELRVTPAHKSDKNSQALWGLTRALLRNMVVGVTKGYSKSLEVNGVGFKVALQGSTLVLHVGFSHPVEYALPKGVAAIVEKNVVTISGVDKQLVGHVAAQIRQIRKPEPYKGKGIKYTDEVIRRKVGKVMKTAA